MNGLGTKNIKKKGKDLLTREGVRCHCELQGTTPELIRWAADQPLEDISIGPPDLERLFHSYYQTADD